MLELTLAYRRPPGSVLAYTAEKTRRTRRQEIFVRCRKMDLSLKKKEAGVLTKTMKVPREYVVALAIALAHAVLRRKVSPGAAYLVSDSLFVAGMTLIMIGAAYAVHNSGLFDFTRHGFKIYIDLVLNRKRERKAQGESGPDSEPQKRRKGVLSPIVGGLLCLLASVAAGAASL